MILQVFQRFLLAVLLAILIFNLTQRRHLAHGERKRLASLAFAGLALLHYAATIVILRLSLPETLLAIPIALTTFLVIRFRKMLLLFRLHCAGCGTPLPIPVTLYQDHNLCPDCRKNGESVDGKCRKPENVSEIDWKTWEPNQTAALCFVINDHKILLIRKKKGLGAGKINMPGGKIEPGETALEAAVRECKEEVGIVPHAPEKRADLSFEFTDGLSLHCSAFFACSHSGEAVETDEADPFWCDIDKIPFTEMWEDDALWIPRALEGEFLKGVFIFDGDSMLSKDIQTVESFD